VLAQHGAPRQTLKAAEKYTAEQLAKCNPEGAVNLEDMNFLVGGVGTDQLPGLASLPTSEAGQGCMPGICDACALEHAMHSVLLH
jgi:hypothetical protein